jgi:hypothetical protein
MSDLPPTISVPTDEYLELLKFQRRVTATIGWLAATVRDEALHPDSATFAKMRECATGALIELIEPKPQQVPA